MLKQFMKLESHINAHLTIGICTEVELKSNIQAVYEIEKQHKY